MSKNGLVNADGGATLPTVDLKKARAFYGETLGLREVEIPGDGNDAAMFQSGDNTSIFLYRRDRPPKAGHTVVGWMVRELEPIMEDLRSRGVEFEQYNLPEIKTNEKGVAVSISDGYKSAWFKDPDGNILAITEMQ